MTPMRDFLSLLRLTGAVLCDTVPLMLAWFAENLRHRRAEIRRQRLHARLTRRLLRNPSEVEMMRTRMQLEVG